MPSQGNGGCLCSLENPAPATRVRTIIHSAGVLGVRVSISFPGPFPTRPLLYRACARHPRRRPFSWGSCWAPWVRQRQQESQNPDLTAALPERLKRPLKDGSLALDVQGERSHPVTGGFESNHHHVCCCPDSGMATKLQCFCSEKVPKLDPHSTLRAQRDGGEAAGA